MHCCEAFSLSQSVLTVGSQEVAWIWDRRPAPATPPTPSPTPERAEACKVGETATMGGEGPWLKVLPKPIGATATADMGGGGTTAGRPLCAAAAGGGEAGWTIEWAPLVAECPTGRELAKVGRSGTPLLGAVTPKPSAPTSDSSAKVSAMAPGGWGANDGERREVNTWYGGYSVEAS